MTGTGAYSAIKAMIKTSWGEENIVAIPRPLLLLTGDPTAALVLSQVSYYSQHQGDTDGWVALPYGWWTSRYGLSEYKVRGAVKRLKEKQFGFDTKRRKVNGAPTLHYRLKMDQFIPFFTTWLQNETWENSRLEPGKSQDSIEPGKSQDSYKDQDQIKIQEPSAPKRAHTKKRFSADQMNPIKDEIVRLFGWNPDTMTREEWGMIQKAAHSWLSAQGTVDELSKVHAYCKAHYEQFGPVALVTNRSKGLTWQASNGAGAATRSPDEAQAATDDDNFLEVDESEMRDEQGRPLGGTDDDRD